MAFFAGNQSYEQDVEFKFSTFLLQKKKTGIFFAGDQSDEQDVRSDEEEREQQQR